MTKEEIRLQHLLTLNEQFENCPSYEHLSDFQVKKVLDAMQEVHNKAVDVCAKRVLQFNSDSITELILKYKI